MGDLSEAKRIVAGMISELRALPYDELIRLRKPRHEKVTGESGASYLVERQSFWDSTRKKGDLRVMVDLYRAERTHGKPDVIEDFIKASDGSFVGE